MTPTTKRQKTNSPSTPLETSASRQSPNDSGAQKSLPPYRKFDWAKVTADFNFQIQYHPDVEPSSSKKNKKRKRESGSPDKKNKLQKSPFNSTDLDTFFSVQPSAYWEDCNRYRRFTISNESFEVGDNIFINQEEEQSGSSAAIPNWVGRVLEVRAADEAHVYLRIVWLYRPEDLPTGRLPYHGRHEVIASNDMQIVDAMTVHGKAVVKAWDEWDDNSEVLDPDSLYWRQTFDARSSKLSEPRKHCRDKAPFNPDTILVRCENKSCNAWLHSACLVDDAVERAHKKFDLPPPKSASAAALASAAADEDGKSTPKAGSKRKSNAGGRRRSKKSLNAAEDDKAEPVFAAELVNPSESDRDGTKPSASATAAANAEKAGSTNGEAENAEAGESSSIAVKPNPSSPTKEEDEEKEAKPAAETVNSKIRVRDLRPDHEGESWEEDACCLICGEKLA